MVPNVAFICFQTSLPVQQHKWFIQQVGGSSSVLCLKPDSRNKHVPPPLLLLFLLLQKQVRRMCAHACECVCVRITTFFFENLVKTRHNNKKIYKKPNIRLLKEKHNRMWCTWLLSHLFGYTVMHLEEFA